MAYQGRFPWIQASRNYLRGTVSIRLDQRLAHRVGEFTGRGLRISAELPGGGVALVGRFTPDLGAFLSDCFGFPSEERRLLLRKYRRSIAAT
jgi:hypothetical protein